MISQFSAGQTECNGLPALVKGKHEINAFFRTERIPSTLVKVSTGLLQAESGATLAECFFIISSSDRQSSARVAYIPVAGVFPIA